MRPVLLALLACLALPLRAADFEIANRDSAGLIRALQAAAASPGTHHIRLFPRGLYTLTFTDSDGLALPPIRGRVTVHGNGAELRGWTHRPMHFVHVLPGAEARLLDLTLAEASQGALRNEGLLDLERVVISDSTGRGDTPLIWNRGSLSMRHSRLEYNLIHAPGGEAALLRNEGALHIEGGSMTGNRISRTRDRPMHAAALWNRGTLRLDSLSLEDNQLLDLLGAAELQTVVQAAGSRISGSLSTPR